MSKYILDNPVIIDLLRNDKIVVIDGGARGELFPPFNALNREIVQVLRFEPDANAQPEDNSENDLVFNKALWNSKGKIDINIAKAPASSSVFPFNTELQQYIDPHKHVRITEKVVTVDSISLDELVTENPDLKIDFIKLDIHGAEYEVLQGATKTLQSTLGLLIETWTIPIHVGQKTRAHVEALAYENMFYVFEEYPRAVWARGGAQYSKKQVVALDTLFFKDPLLDSNVKTQVDAIKLIGLANLFGHNGYAIQLSKDLYQKKILEEQFYTLIVDLLKNLNTTVKNNLALKLDKLQRKYSTCAFK